MEYLTPNQAQKQFGYHPKTLADWADAGKIECIRSPGGHRRYPITAFINIPTQQKQTILYARVSTRTQLDALDSQIRYLSEHYPGSPLVKDIASGMNSKRKQFIRLMEKVAKQEVGTIVVAHKDRLCRFGFEFVEWFCLLNECQIVVLNNNKLSPQEELMQDFMSIMHCMSSRLYFLRAYEKKLEQEYQNSSEKE
jgi:predicted site-specific integrase-resolvase